MCVQRHVCTCINTCAHTYTHILTYTQRWKQRLSSKKYPNLPLRKLFHELLKWFQGYYFIIVCGYVCTEHSIHVEVRGKLGRCGFLLVALCVFWGPNTGHQACILGWKAILPSEPSGWPSTVCFYNCTEVSVSFLPHSPVTGTFYLTFQPSSISSCICFQNRVVLM